MPGISTRVATLAVTLVIVAIGPVAGADDEIEGAAAPRPAVVRPAPIDLAAHIDINVLLPDDHWRVSSGPGRVVIGGGGRLVIEGHLTLGGEAVPAAPERIRRTDEAVETRLREAQRQLVVQSAALFPQAGVRSLELASELDIRRVMVDVAVLRDRYAGARAQLGDDEWRRFQKDVEACRRSLADPFGTDSLVAAVRAGLVPEGSGR